MAPLAYLKYLFEGVDLDNSRVLDIGGGNGVFSFYAALNGAEEVICLEPEEAGSRSSMQSKFERMSTSLGLANV